MEKEMLWILGFGLLLAAASLLPAVVVYLLAGRRLVDVRDQYKRTASRLEAESLEARLTVDHIGCIRSYNHRAEQMFGFHGSEIIGRTLDRLVEVSPDVPPSGIVESLYRGKRSSDLQALEVVGRRKDGSFFPMELHVSETGEYAKRKFHMTARDMTGHQRGAYASQRLQWLEAMLHCAPAPMLILNGDGEIEHHNLMFEKMSGYSNGEIRHRHFWDLLLDAGDGDRSRLELQRLIALAGTGSQRMMWRLRSGRRQEFLVTVAGVPLHDIQTGGEGPSMAPAAMVVGFPISRIHELEDSEAGGRASFALDDAVAGLRPLLGRLLGERIRLSLSPAGENPEVVADRRTLEHLILTVALGARDAMSDGGRLELETSTVSLDGASAYRIARLGGGRYAVLTITGLGSGPEGWLQADMASIIGALREQGGNAVIQSIPNSGCSLHVYLPASESKGLFLVKSAAG